VEEEDDGAVSEIRAVAYINTESALAVDSTERQGGGLT